MTHFSQLHKVLPLLTIVTLFSCTSGTKTDTAQDKLLNDSTRQVSQLAETTYSFKDSPQKFIVTNSKGREIELPSGTFIKIPANCFVDAGGKRIDGDVELAFEEFLSPGSIISSQIIMKYDSGGIVRDFESAGMFRINAFRDGKEVLLAKNKSIDVNLVTNDSDTDFNTYYSTHDGSDWQFLEKSKAQPNQRKKETAERSAAILKNTASPTKPQAYKANGRYFDLNLNKAYTHDLKNLLGVVWEYAGSNEKLDPAVNKTNFNRAWDFVSILPQEGDKRGIYTIVLQSKDTGIKTIARPVFRGSVLDAENEEFAAELGEFNKRMETAREEQKQAIAEAPFMRLVSVKNLGLYNYDRQYKYEDMIPVLANFNFGADSLKNYPISVYLITGNGMAVIKYPPHDWDKFMYSRPDVNKLIAILPDQEICTFSAKRFEKEGPVFPKTQPGKFTFKLQHTGVKATNSSDIDRIINTI